MIRVLGISGSLRKNSFNSVLLQTMGELCPEGIDFHISNIIDRLPYFNPDIDDIENPQESVALFRKKIREADVVILCSPEYAHNISGVLKNALDWIVGSGELVNKPVVVINVSTSFMGGDKAHASLKYLVKLISANLLEEVSFQVSGASHKFDKNGRLSDPETILKMNRIFDYVKNNLPVLPQVEKNNSASA